MTDSWLMDSECIHGVVWYECEECFKDQPLENEQPPENHLPK